MPKTVKNVRCLADKPFNHRGFRGCKIMGIFSVLYGVLPINLLMIRVSRKDKTARQGVRVKKSFRKDYICF